MLLKTLVNIVGKDSNKKMANYQIFDKVNHLTIKCDVTTNNLLPVLSDNEQDLCHQNICISKTSLPMQRSHDTIASDFSA